MLEPVKSCNLQCRYCYANPADTGPMDIGLAGKAIRKAARFGIQNAFGCLHIIWHGGEPLLAGVDFYRQVWDDIDRVSRQIPVQVFLQTNGLLLTKDFCNFFLSHRIQVGISLDGPADIHDGMRRAKSGKGTHGQVLERIAMAAARGLNLGLCMVVTRSCLGREKEIYRFFQSTGLPFRANPVLPHFSGKTEKGVTLQPGEYGLFLCRLFDEWIATTDNRVAVSPLDGYLQSLVDGKSPNCQHQPSCAGNHINVRPDGTTSFCSRFQHLDLGNIDKISLEEIFNGSLCSDIKCRSQTLSECRRCRFRQVCQGGCPHNAMTFTGEILARDPFCPDYRLLFTHLLNAIDENGSQRA